MTAGAGAGGGVGWRWGGGGGGGGAVPYLEGGVRQEGELVRLEQALAGVQEHRVGDGFGESVHPAPHVLVPFCRAHRFVEHGIKGLGKRGRGEEVSGTGTAEKNKKTKQYVRQI